MFKLALITGATSGIGLELARRFAKNGIALILTGRSEEKLAPIIKELNPLKTVVIDLAKDRTKLIEIIHEYSPDLVVNNAGFGLYGEALTHSTKEQMEVLTVNGNALLEISLEAARTLISNKQQGMIVNISSAGGFLPFPCFAVYAATKAFVTSFSEAFDAEIRPHGVRCLATCPGMVKTKFKEHAGGKKGDHSSLSMPVTEAIDHIWWQIEKEKPVHTFNWRTRLAIALAQFLPINFRMKKMRQAIESRIKSRTFIPIDKS